MLCWRRNGDDLLEDIKNGWGDAPGGKTWICPECKKTSKIEDWKECEMYCEDCGDHEGRECPECEERFDYVWDDDKIKSGD